MKNIAYRIISTIGFVLTIPLAIAMAACMIMVVVHKAVHTGVKLAFDQKDPYMPMRDLAELGWTISDLYEKLYNDCYDDPDF